eukprot:COSAG05_NODE_25742_length_194_cov_18.105263_1_plen_30_part_10
MIFFTLASVDTPDAYIIRILMVTHDLAAPP